MELLQLTYFCHAATCENFSKTAEHYNVPTSNISRAVRSLERELGVKLFNRTANKIALNEQGQTFYRFVSRSLKLLDNGKSALSSKDSEPSGEIKLLISTCREIVTQAIEKCRRSYPDIRFLIKHGLEEGDYDFIISDIPPTKKDFDKVPLLTEKMLLAVPTVYGDLRQNTIKTRMQTEAFISLGKGTRLHTLTVQYCNSFGFIPNIALQTDDPHSVIKYLEMGLGVSLFPEKSWAKMVSDDISLFAVGFPSRTTCVFTEKGKELTAAQNAFLKIVIDTFEKT